MAYTAADATTFKARFPAFDAVDDAVINAALVRARRVVDATWLADDRQEAESLHAAHEMTLDGLGATREAQLQGFRRLKLGSLELERESGQSGSSSTYNLTTYGQRFLAILKRNVPGVVALGGSS
ncbi:DUF4054 domain-containing protein [Henriciella mobilis]|uniref:DUF4054 domain-containing protein n=1 Tax=Henriciella mobilis TaxID=2305467 RepID=UPI000E65F697|nr:DUF4054 domain-containing protein [Henriciella mobilis]RIJ15952.1 DUF4054 domain-containing protein [Henriciella mobilis]RIJ21162.1 DUF4054 domain-containing protein [Henriciella mobilis]RIJ23137.1 DUF4054 domain-containing protein [Henriciella mobilis]